MIKRLINTIYWLKNLSATSKRNVFYLLYDVIKLKRSNQLSRIEYENFRMYEQTEEFRKSFLSYSEASRYWELLNPINNACLARNKYLSHCLLQTIHVPKANLYIYYNPEIRMAEDYFAYDYNTVKDIFAKKRIRSFVVKPASDSAHGVGVCVIKDVIVDDEDYWLYKQNGEKIALKKLLNTIPLLFEELVIQNSQMKAFNSSSVNTIRIMTALYPNGNVKTIAAFLKIGRDGADVDNAGDGGNIDCGVDIETGVLYNAIEFNSWKNIDTITYHPDTRALLKDVKIAGWESIIQEVKNYQARLPFLKTIGWDVAITDKGPVIIEINNWWDTTGQLFIQKGWKEQVENCYNAWKLYYANGR